MGIASRKVATSCVVGSVDRCLFHLAVHWVHPSDALPDPGLSHLDAFGSLGALGSVGQGRFGSSGLAKGRQDNRRRRGRCHHSLDVHLGIGFRQHLHTTCDKGGGYALDLHAHSRSVECGRRCGRRAVARAHRPDSRGHFGLQPTVRDIVQKRLGRIFGRCGLAERARS